MKKVKVGVIGTGIMGGFHAGQYKNIKEADLVGIYDQDDNRAKEVSEKYHTKAFGDMGELVSSVDALSIATPTSTHYRTGMACLEAGKHILIEKPITLDPKEADDLIKKAKVNNLVLAVGHIERFNPAYRKFKDMFRERDIEAVNVIDAKRLSPYPERITDASVVLDIMIHDIDLIMDMVNSRIKHIKAVGEKVRSKTLDKVIAQITFENGVTANIEADRLHDKKVRSLLISAGDHAYEVDLIKKEIVKRKEHKKEQVKVSLYDQLQLELSDFIKAIIGNKRPLVPGEEGLEVLKVALKIEDLAVKSLAPGVAKELS